MKNQLIIVGDIGTGKTQLIHSKRGLNYEPTSTIGASYVFDLKKDLIDCCWDMSGHPRFNKLYPLYYRNTHAVVVVFDLTNKQSFSHVEMYVDYAKRFCLQKPFIILVGNKADLVDQQEIREEDIHTLREKLRTENNNILAYVQTSALTGNGVDKLFSMIKKGFKKDTVMISYSFFAQQECSVTDEEMAATYLANREDAQLASS